MDGEDIVATVLKMSPPMLLMVGINVILIAIHKFVPVKWLTPIAVILGGIVIPLLIPESSLAYNVPSPITALVIVGVILGFVARGLHPKFKALLQKFGIATENGETHYITRSDVSPSSPDQQSSLNGQRKNDS